MNSRDSHDSAQKRDLCGCVAEVCHPLVSLLSHPFALTPMVWCSLGSKSMINTFTLVQHQFGDGTWHASFGWSLRPSCYFLIPSARLKDVPSNWC